MSLPIQFEELHQEALKIGWDDAGATTAKIPEEDIKAYQEWISKNYQGEMAYMENQLRLYPEQLFPGAKTALIFITYYKQEKKPFQTDEGVIASYARGRDYHHLHRKRLKKLISWLEYRSGKKQIAKGFSDSTPILEKALAVQAGLGWFGKNSLLIHRRFGTFTLLSGLLTSLEIKFNAPTLELRVPRCGSCQRCMDACPTNAFKVPYQLDATKCLSYHLIESKKTIPDEIRKRNPGYIFGCDICQDVCPHNARTKLSMHEEFSPEQGNGAYLTAASLEKLSEKPENLYGTPLQRRGIQGLRHTLLGDRL